MKLIEEAIAEAWTAPVEQVREAHMLTGDLAEQMVTGIHSDLDARILAELDRNAAFDPADSYSRPLPAQPARSWSNGLRLGIPRADQLEFFGNADAAKLFEGAVETARAHGATITEIDFINGAVVRWGARHQVPTPVNAALVACIKGIERRLALQAAASA